MDYENDSSWVRGMLQPGENLLWTGKPEKLRLFGKEDIFLIPFSLIWCGFLAFMLITAHSSSPGFEKLFFIPFILVGLWLLVGRFLVKLISMKSECYALTTRRLIVKRGNTTNSSELLGLPSMRVTRRSDGSGDIRFGAEFHTEYGARGFAVEKQRVYHRPTFALLGVSDVDRVEYRIRQAMDQLREARD